MAEGDFFHIRDGVGVHSPAFRNFDDAKNEWWIDGDGWRHLGHVRYELQGWLDDLDLYNQSTEYETVERNLRATRNYWRLLERQDRDRSRKNRGRARAGIVLGTRQGIREYTFVSPRLRSGSFRMWEVERVELRRKKYPFYTIRAQQYLPANEAPFWRDVEAHSDKCREHDSKRQGKRARKLLFEHLNDHQREEYERYGHFHVTRWGPMKDYDKLDPSKKYMFANPSRHSFLRYRRYRLYRGFPNGNVVMISASGKPVWNLCLHPAKAFPNDDILLAQKLLLETSEVDFINQANETIPQGTRFEPVKDFAAWCRHN